MTRVRRVQALIVGILLGAMLTGCGNTPNRSDFPHPSKSATALAPWVSDHLAIRQSLPATQSQVSNQHRTGRLGRLKIPSTRPDVDQYN